MLRLVKRSPRSSRHLWDQMVSLNSVKWRALIVILVGMKKMIVNHLEKIFVTSDAATIMTEVCELKTMI